MGRLVVLVALAGLLVAAPAEAKRKPSFRFGLNDAIVRHGQGTARIAGLYSSLGANVQRLDVPWRVIQPTAGTWDWTYLDRAIGEPQARGIGTVAMLSSVPAWAAARDGIWPCVSPACQRPPAPSRLGDFAAFVRALAARYPELAAIEVFNEPNMGSFTWQPRADPEYYARVLRVARDAVRPVASAPPVLSGGVGPLPDPAPVGSMDPIEFLTRMYRAGARGAMDGLGVHPYPGISAPYDPETSGFHRYMARVREVRDAAGDTSLPLWITETGYTTAGGPRLAVSLGQQTRWLPDLVLKAFAWSDVEAVVVHTLVDGSGREGFGLLTADLTPKPVFARLADAVRRARQLRLGMKKKRCTRKSRSRRCRRAVCRRRARKRVKLRCRRQHCSRRMVRRLTRRALRRCDRKYRSRARRR